MMDCVILTTYLRGYPWLLLRSVSVVVDDRSQILGDRTTLQGFARSLPLSMNIVLFLTIRRSEVDHSLLAYCPMDCEKCDRAVKLTPNCPIVTKITNKAITR